jgi:hypothetical protein
MICWLYVLFLIPAFLNGIEAWHETQEGISAQATFSTKSLTLPNPLIIELALEYPETLSPDKEAMKVHLLQNSRFQSTPFILVKEDISSPTLEGGVIRQIFTYVLQPQITGKQGLTFLNIPFNQKQDSKSKSIQFISPIFFVDVHTPKALLEPADYIAPLLPITTPLPLEMNNDFQRQWLNNPAIQAKGALENQSLARAKAFPWLGLLSLLVGGGIYYWMRKRPKLLPKQAVGLNKSAKAYSQALTLLANLKQNASTKEIDQFFVILTDAVRYWLEEYYQWPAIQQTTSEFLQYAARDERLAMEEKANLKIFLEKCDAVKFAKYQASLADCEASFQAAGRFLTHPKASI